jgi:hypothetical protein
MCHHFLRHLKGKISIFSDKTDGGFSNSQIISESAEMSERSLRLMFLKVEISYLVSRYRNIAWGKVLL